MVTKIGKDAFADMAINKLKEENMTTEFVFKTADVPTGTAIIMVDERTSQNQIMVNLSACATFNDDDIESIKPLIKKSQYLLTQLETNVDAIEKIIDLAIENGVKIVLNPAPIQPIDDEMYKKIDIITPNEVEASILTNVQIKTTEDALKAAYVFFSKGVENVVITLGKMGVLAVTKKGSKLFENYDVKVVDTTGAGDAFNGGLSSLFRRKEFI